MSSLLDILHRRTGEPEHEAGPEGMAQPALQTVELRLAVDNGSVQLADEPVAYPEDPESHAGPVPLMPTDAFATVADAAAQLPPEADNTRVLLRNHLQRRSRQNTALLGVALCVIVIGALLATWLLNETSGLAGDVDVLFSVPAVEAAFTDGTMADAAEPPIAVPEPSGAGAALEIPDLPRVAGRIEADKLVDEDTDWYDMPAIEEAATAGSDEPIRITRGTTTNPLFARLSEAWTAFQAADFARAEALYQEVRAADPRNVDALLGLGALATRSNRLEEARRLYREVLLAEPRNAAAISAISTLPPAGARSLDESALKSLLRDQPGAANLHFALGLQHVAQGRWPDAQAAFFDAVRHDPGNADYAYNLAVSLDQLGQSEPAAAYYRRALDLTTASSLFIASVAADRLAVLRSGAP